MVPDFEFKRIVVAYDGSRDSKKALQAACLIAKKTGGRLRIVHVYSLPVYVFAGSVPVPQTGFELVERYSKEKANRTATLALKDAEGQGVNAKVTVLESGSIVESILDYALKEQADLIVVGTRGLTGFKKLVIGSVSSGVLNHAHCSVLVVR